MDNETLTTQTPNETTRQAERHALAANHLLHQARTAYIEAYGRVPDEDNSATKGFLNGYAYRLSLEYKERLEAKPVHGADHDPTLAEGKQKSSAAAVAPLIEALEDYHLDARLRFDSRQDGRTLAACQTDGLGSSQKSSSPEAWPDGLLQCWVSSESIGNPSRKPHKQ